MSEKKKNAEQRELEKLMDDLVNLRDELNEERSERKNLEAALTKSRKKLARAREQRGATESQVHEAQYAQQQKEEALTRQIDDLRAENAQLRGEVPVNVSRSTFTH